MAACQFSVFSQMGVKDGDMNGYVKPLFANIKVYDYQKDKTISVSRMTGLPTGFRSEGSITVTIAKSPSAGAPRQ